MEHDIKQFWVTSLRALVRADVQGRVPARLTGTGRAVWATFRNELTAADLVCLCIEDAGVTMPIPFDPAEWWPDWPARTQPCPQPADAERWIAEALTDADQPRDAYLRQQAAALEVAVAPEGAVAGLPTPLAHERWLELPGTGGWIGCLLSTREEANLYFWENFHVVCGTPQEVMLAGLIAWELGAPPRTSLPIRLDPELDAILRSGESYHAVVGRRDLHGRRDLRVLDREGKRPLWL